MGRVKCQTIAGILDELAPRRLAEDWDNVGLLVGDGKQKIKKVMVCLDVPQWVIEEAIEKNIDMIVSHHPMIFGGIKRVNTDTAVGRKIISLIKNNISLYCMHTNYDIVSGGLNEIFAKELGFSESSVIREICKEEPGGFGRIASLEKETTLSLYADTVKAVLGADSVSFAGDPNSRIKKVALLNGSGSKFMNSARFAGADVLVTGDMQYHDILDALEMGLCIVDAGHFSTEKIMIRHIAEFLRNKLQELKLDAKVVESSANTEILRVL